MLGSFLLSRGLRSSKNTGRNLLVTCTRAKVEIRVNVFKILGHRLGALNLGHKFHSMVLKGDWSICIAL